MWKDTTCRRGRMPQRLLWALGMLLPIAANTGCGAKIYKHDMLADPAAADAAEIYVFRSEGVVGGLVRTEVKLDGEPLFKIGTGSYAKAFIEPGIHNIEIGEISAVQNYRGGRTYHFGITAPSFTSAMTGGGNELMVDMVDQETATKLMQELKPVDEIAATPQRYSSQLDRTLPLLERAAWIADDFENAERGFGMTQVGEEFATIERDLKAHLANHPEDAEAAILLARLTRARVQSMPLIVQGGEVPEEWHEDTSVSIETAEAALEEARVHHPDKGQLYYWQSRLQGLLMPTIENGRMVFRPHNATAAIELAQKAVELDPTNADFTLALARWLMDDDRLNEALEATAHLDAGQHPMHQLLRDLQALAPPDEAEFSILDTMSLTEQQQSRARFISYPELRVRFYAVATSHQELQAHYAQTWPELELLKLDTQEMEDGGELRMLGRFFEQRSGILTPTKKKSHVMKAHERNGVVLTVIEYAGTSVTETPAGMLVDPTDPMCFLVIVNYSHDPLISKR